MEAQLTEPLSFPAEDYAKSWFHSYPVDSRFLNTSYQSFMPTSSIDGKIITFEGAKFESPSIYLIQDTVLKVTCKICKADGTLPSKTALVAPVNNVLYSLFESVALKINEKDITKSPSDYPYKCYISNALTYSTIVKGSQLQSVGYYGDLSGHFDEFEDNSGFMSRNSLFREDFGSTDQNYRQEGATFIGKLYHDLSTCETGLPPNTKFKFSLTKSTNEFVLLKKSSDTEKYELKITEITLLMPIASLSQSVYNEFSSYQTRTLNNKPVGIPYRNIEIRNVTMPRNLASFYSELLFSDNMPTRIIVCFVEQQRKTGHYNSNPFLFNRKWKVQKLDAQATRQTQDPTPKELLLEKCLQETIAMNKLLLERLQVQDQPTDKGKGPKRGKNTRNVGPSRFAEFTQREQSITSDDSEPQQGPSSARLTRNGGYGPDPPPPPPPPQFKDVFLKKVELTLNGAPIDALEDTQNIDECMEQFWRMIVFNGLATSPFSNGISYFDFRNGFFFATFDLTTSSKAGKIHK